MNDGRKDDFCYRANRKSTKLCKAALSQLLDGRKVILAGGPMKCRDSFALPIVAEN